MSKFKNCLLAAIAILFAVGCLTLPAIVSAQATQQPAPRVVTVNAGEAITLSTPGVTGGENYGNVTYTWTTSAGTIVGSGTNARLDTTGVPAGSTIDVQVTATNDLGTCRATGSFRVTVAAPPPTPPPPTCAALTSCTTFGRNVARVDNACKSVLADAARALQGDAQATLVVDAFRAADEREGLDRQRGKNVRDRLADGSVGLVVEASRITVRAGGPAAGGGEVKLLLCPAGAVPPAGPAAESLGPVEPERGAPQRRRQGRP